MMVYYFIWGSGITLSLNSWLMNFTDSLLAGIVSIIGGIAGSVTVAWLKRKWERRK